jgi:dTDP-glucose 4,6-dehydratase
MGLIILTGATGFVGINLVAHLHRFRPGAEILCLGRDERKLAALSTMGYGVETAQADLGDPAFADKVGKLVGNRPVDCLVHLASRLTSPADDIEHVVDGLRVNGLGTVAVWKLIERLLTRGGIASVVHVSSILVYGHHGRRPVAENTVLAPRDTYGASKAAGEYVARYLASKHEVSLTIMRPGFIYGPRDSSGKVIYRFVEAAMRGHDLVIRADPETFRDYIHVDDVCRAIHLAMGTHAIQPKVMNVSSGSPITLEHLAAIACSVTGSDSRILVHRPADIRGDPFYGCIVADSRKLRALIGNPVTIEDGIKQLVGSSCD